MKIGYSLTLTKRRACSWIPDGHEDDHERRVDCAMDAGAMHDDVLHLRTCLRLSRTLCLLAAQPVRPQRGRQRDAWGHR